MSDLNYDGVEAARLRGLEEQEEKKKFTPCEGYPEKFPGVAIENENQEAKAIETTNFHNETYRTYRSAAFGKDQQIPQHKLALGHEAWHWPEFIAFAERLGVDLGRLTPALDLSIKIPVHGFVVITQDYFGRDFDNDGRTVPDDESDVPEELSEMP